MPKLCYKKVNTLITCAVTKNVEKALKLFNNVILQETQIL